MLKEKFLWKNAKMMATKSQMITNKWNCDEGYLIIDKLYSMIDDEYGTLTKWVMLKWDYFVERKNTLGLSNKRPFKYCVSKQGG